MNFLGGNFLELSSFFGFPKGRGVLKGMGGELGTIGIFLGKLWECVGNPKQNHREDLGSSP